MTLLLATTNRDKIREIRVLLDGVAATVVTLRERPRVAEPDETGSSFEANARLKAMYYDGTVGHALRADGATDGRVLTIAEDSGLEVDALGGEPGVRSARFLAPDASYADRFAEIQARLARQPDAPRTARFVCAVAVAEGGHVVYEARGTIEGQIATEARGTAGFGYDPIFEYPPLARTLAEVTETEKLAVAHRGEAFRAVARWLRNP